MVAEVINPIQQTVFVGWRYEVLKSLSEKRLSCREICLIKSISGSKAVKSTRKFFFGQALKERFLLRLISDLCFHHGLNFVAGHHIDT